MDIKAQRLEILQQVENGEITLEEASRWLAALDRIKSKNGSQPQIETGMDTGMQDFTADENVAVLENPIPAGETASPAVIEAQPVEDVQEPGQGEVVAPRQPSWRGWWLLVFIPGLLLLVAAVNWMIAGYQAAGLSWGFWLSFIPFTIGILMTWLGWEVRSARWFYLHVTQKNKPGPRDIMISFPLPVGLVSWGIRRFGHFAGPMRGKDVQGILNELDQAVAKDGPMHIFVDDEDGDQVEIWIDGPRSK